MGVMIYQQKKQRQTMVEMKGSLREDTGEKKKSKRLSTIVRKRQKRQKMNEEEKAAMKKVSPRKSDAHKSPVKKMKTYIDSDESQPSVEPVQVEEYNLQESEEIYNSMIKDEDPTPSPKKQSPGMSRANGPKVNM